MILTISQNELEIRLTVKMYKFNIHDTWKQESKQIE